MMPLTSVGKTPNHCSENPRATTGRIPQALHVWQRFYAIVLKTGEHVNFSTALDLMSSSITSNNDQTPKQT